MLNDGEHILMLDSTDVYGIGALLYHLLTLERPWNHHQDIKQALDNKQKRRLVKETIYNAVSLIRFSFLLFIYLLIYLIVSSCQRRQH